MSFSIGSEGGPGDRVAERRSGRETARETAADGSRGGEASRPGFRATGGAGGRLGVAILGLGIAAAVLMIATEFTTVAKVTVGDVACERVDCVKSGGEQHSYALLLVAVLTVVMALGAGPGRSRPAALALIAVGALVLGVALLLDLPDTSETGVIGKTFEDARASAGGGFSLEILAGLSALAAGALRFIEREPG